MRASRCSRVCLACWVLAAAMMLLLVGCAEEESTAPAVGTTVTAPSATTTPTPTLAPTATGEPTPTAVGTAPVTARATSTARPTATATSTPTPRPRPTAIPISALATQYPELAPVLNNPEVDTIYKELAVAFAQGGQERALATVRQRGLLTPEGDIRLDLVLDVPATEETVARLQSMGIMCLGVDGSRVMIAVPQALLMSGANEPGAALNQLSGIEHVTALLPPQ